MKWKLRAYGPPSADNCFAIVQIDTELARRILDRMRLFEVVKTSDPGLKAIKYWPGSARWFAGTTICEVERLDEHARAGRAMRVEFAEMVVTDAAVWWSCLAGGTDHRLVTTGLPREDVMTLVGKEDRPCAPSP